MDLFMCYRNTPSNHCIVTSQAYIYIFSKWPYRWYLFLLKLIYIIQYVVKKQAPKMFVKTNTKVLRVLRVRKGAD